MPTLADSSVLLVSLDERVCKCCEPRQQHSSMETSDTSEGDAATMDVDGGMVSMDTNDDEFDPKEPATEGASGGDNSTDMEVKDRQELVPALPGQVQSSQTGACQAWRLPEGVCRKTVLQGGVGMYGPVSGARCSITLQVTSPVSELDFDAPSSVGYPIGTADVQVGHGGTPISRLLDEALISMKKGEVSEVCVSGLRCSSDASTNSTPTASSSSSSSKDVSFRIVLHDFTAETTPPWCLTPGEKHDLAKTHKERGVELFKTGNVYAAFAHFRTASRLLLSILPFSFEENEEEEREASYKQLLCQCYLNLAACQVKTGHHAHVVSNCTHALGIDPDNVKALYRRAQANASLGNYLLAQGDAERGLRREPLNGALGALMESVSGRLTQSQSQLAQGLSKMFS